MADAADYTEEFMNAWDLSDVPQDAYRRTESAIVITSRLGDAESLKNREIPSALEAILSRAASKAVVPLETFSQLQYWKRKVKYSSDPSHFLLASIIMRAIDDDATISKEALKNNAIVNVVIIQSKDNPLIGTRKLEVYKEDVRAQLNVRILTYRNLQFYKFKQHLKFEVKVHVLKVESEQVHVLKVESEESEHMAGNRPQESANDNARDCKRRKLE